MAFMVSSGIDPSVVLSAWIFLMSVSMFMRLSRGQPTSKEEPSLTVGSDYLRDTAEGVRAWAEELFPGLRVSVTLLPSKF